MRGFVITVDGRVEDIPDLSFAGMQELVGGYVELIKFGRSGCAYLNEDGKGLGLPYNRLATLLCLYFRVGLAPGDFIVGPLIITGPLDRDGNDTDIATQVADTILWLHARYQR